MKFPKLLLQPKILFQMGPITLAVLILLAVFGLGYGFAVIPFEAVYAYYQKPVTVHCQSSEPIQSCTWTTPYGETYALSHGLTTEQGRLEYFTDDNNLSCGLIIKDADDKDAGDWECSVGVVNKHSEVSQVNAKGRVELAKKPDSIHLGEPFDQGTADVSDDWNQKPIKCVVHNAHPKPKFSWFVGDEKLSGYKVEDEGKDHTWTQTLKYSPLARHANQTLKCVVDHIALGEGDNKEAAVVLRFMGLSEDYLQEIEDHKTIKGAALDPYVPMYIVGSSILLILVTSFGMKCKNMCKDNRAKLDLENRKSVTESSEECTVSPFDPEEETRKHDEDVAVEAKSTFKKLALFFACDKKENSHDDDVTVSENSLKEPHKIDLDKVEGQDDVSTTEEERPSTIKSFMNIFGCSKTPAEDNSDKTEEKNDVEEEQVNDEQGINEKSEPKPEKEKKKGKSIIKPVKKKVPEISIEFTILE